MTRKKIKSLRPTHAEIDLTCFGHNIEKAREKAGTDIIAIVKADGYGHGALKLAAYAYEQHKVKKFGVATILEGMILREYLGSEPVIMILGYVDEQFFSEVLEHNLVLTMVDDAFAKKYNEYLKRNNRRAYVSVKIDTGMNRLGYDPDLNWYDFTSRYENLRPIHVMSHMSSSDSEREYSQHQIEIFKSFIEKNNIRCHTSLFNSSGIAGYDNTFSLARPGLMLYGYLYSENDVELKKVMRIYSKVVHVKTIKKGEAVSYNRKYFAEKDMTIGVVPIGYADGYPRCFSNLSYMMVDGKKCPVVGAVCMDMTMIDLTGVDTDKDLQVEILGDNIDASMWADWAGTISYEMLCGISDRIPRIYVG
jgi:alanine racemase